MFDATPKSPTANSFLTVERALALIADGRPYATSFTGLTTQQQQQYLVWATTLINTAFDWDGWRRTVPQALHVPRSGLRDADGYPLDYDTIPLMLELATIEQALALTQRDPSAFPDMLGLGLSSATLGPIKVTMDPREMVPYIDEGAVGLLVPIARLRSDFSAGMGGAKVVKLGRG